MLFAIRCSPALPIPPASARHSNHFFSAASALFQEKRFYAPFVFNTLRTLCIVKFPSTPAFPEACALFGEKHGCGGYLSSSPLFSISSALFPTATLSFRGNGGTCLCRCSTCEQGRFTSSTSVHNDAQTVHFAAKNVQYARISLQKRVSPGRFRDSCENYRAGSGNEQREGLYRRNRTEDSAQGPAGLAGPRPKITTSCRNPSDTRVRSECGSYSVSCR